MGRGLIGFLKAGVLGTRLSLAWADAHGAVVLMSKVRSNLSTRGTIPLHPIANKTAEFEALKPSTSSLTTDTRTMTL